jgi:hypothetical protein
MGEKNRSAKPDQLKNRHVIIRLYLAVAAITLKAWATMFPP